MSDVRIYKPKKTAMQSGIRGTRKWILEFIQPAYLYVDPLMRWTGCLKSNSLRSRVFFETCQEAVEYAKSKRLTYSVENPCGLKMVPKRYSDNFMNSKKF